MPNYTYWCKVCGQIEIEHSIKDEPKKICPKCGKDGLKRLIGNNTNFILNGDGWSKDNYNKKGVKL
jgi:putative FmdB family regulatory protein